MEGDHLDGDIFAEIYDFYPRPPGGGRLLKSVCISASCFISIHALRVEGDIYAKHSVSRRRHFYPRPPGGGRHEVFRHPTVFLHFYPRPPGGGRQFCAARARRQFYFYPRPPGGGRREVSCLHRKGAGFLSTPSGWRATPRPVNVSPSLRFLSTPSGWRATAGRYYVFEGRLCISIHALRVEGDA